MAVPVVLFALFLFSFSVDLSLTMQTAAQIRSFVSPVLVGVNETEEFVDIVRFFHNLVFRYSFHIRLFIIS